MAEETMWDREGNWKGSPLTMGRGLDPTGIQEISIQFDTGEEEVLKPQLRDEFYSYELHMTSTYLHTLAHQLRLSRK